VLLLLSQALTLLWDIQAGKWDTKAFWEAMFISVLVAAQQIPIQRLSSENKGALPYIPLQAGYRSKKQSLTHIWLLVISLATSSSVRHDHFQVQFKFQFPAMSSSPPHFITSPFDAWTYIGSKSIILI
jgi:hypothetical protein